jgi:glycosyltransferase involved in cell wall biosynthesis
MCDLRGCHTHQYHPDLFKDKIVTSFCNGFFLQELPRIVRAGKPKCTIWHNCMTWPFQAEMDAFKAGLIDKVAYVSEYQKTMLRLAWERAGVPIPETFEGYRPHFNPCNHVGWDMSLKPTEYFGVGRISRDDPGKFAPDTWDIFRGVKADRPVRVFILGYGYEARKKLGPPPQDLDGRVWYPGEVSPQVFYRHVHCVIHKTGGSRESYCRIVPECYATGTVIVAENDYAFPELVRHGQTGFLCDTSEQMSASASALASHPDQAADIAMAARRHLDAIAGDEACWPAWQKILS